MTNSVGPALPGDAFVQSLARGLTVISCFDAQHGALTLTEVAGRTGLTRATARRLLLTLVELGYVRLDARQFTLTPQVLRLGTAYLSGMGLPEIAQPHLERLSAKVGESTSLAVLDGTDIVYIARVAGDHRLMRAGITVGTRFPAYATSMGRVLLAALDPLRQAAVLADVEFTPRTEHTVTGPDELRQVLAVAARDGHALVDQELEAGLRSVAAPVRDVDGTTVAAVNMSMAAAGPAIIDAALLASLLGTAAAISTDLMQVR